MGVSCVTEYTDAETTCELIEKLESESGVDVSFNDPDSSFCMSQEESDSEEESTPEKQFFFQFHWVPSTR